MYPFQPNSSTIGAITSGITHDTLVAKTIKFTYDSLPAWRDDPKRVAVSSEPDLNTQLCKFLDSRARADFPMVSFFHEERQHGRRYIDLSVCPASNDILNGVSIYDTIIVVECKRLPAPDKDRETEYVSGGLGNITGGIQRIKLGLHGDKHEVVMMVGYIQSDDFAHWLKTINDWIQAFALGILPDECAWATNEVLSHIGTNPVDMTSSYISSHARSKLLKSVTIHHLWVDLPPSGAPNPDFSVKHNSLR